jgi:hypothetical protein
MKEVLSMVYHWNTYERTEKPFAIVLSRGRGMRDGGGEPNQCTM